MTDTTQHPPGIVTDAEAERLADPATDLADHGALRARIRTRLVETLRDCSVLYPRLPAEDLTAVFAGDDGADDAARRARRASTQDALALLVLGMLLGDDMLETRLREAIYHAGASYGEDIDVTLALRRGPLPSLERFAAHLDDEGVTDRSLTLFEHFRHDPETAPAALERAASKLGIELTSAERAAIAADAPAFERPPQSVITDISVTDPSADDPDTAP